MKRLSLDPTSALAQVRGNLIDIETENIAVLASRAAGIDDLIPLWYGEGDLVTPEPIRAAAQASLLPDVGSVTRRYKRASRRAAALARHKDAPLTKASSST